LWLIIIQHSRPRSLRAFQQLSHLSNNTFNRQSRACIRSETICQSGTIGISNSVDVSRGTLSSNLGNNGSDEISFIWIQWTFEVIPITTIATLWAGVPTTLALRVNSNVAGTVHSRLASKTINCASASMKKEHNWTGGICACISSSNCTALRNIEFDLAVDSRAVRTNYISKTLWRLRKICLQGRTA